MGLTLQNPRSDHQPLDLVRPFINLRDARVPVLRPLDGILAAVAVAAVDLNGSVRDSRRHLARKKLRDSCECMAKSFGTGRTPGGLMILKWPVSVVVGL
jgi:hypothetical protein